MSGKKRFYVAAALVAALLVGLIVVQLYWVRNAYQLKEVEFNNKVEGILRQSARFIDGKVDYFYLYSRAYIQPGDGVMVLNTNSDTLRLFNTFPYTSRPDTCFYNTPVSNYNKLTMVDVTMRFEDRPYDSIYNIRQLNRELQQLDSSNYQARLDDPRTADKVIDVPELDSVLATLVMKAGLEKDFCYGVKRKDVPVFDIVSDEKAHAKLMSSAHRVELFADRAFTRPFELVLFIGNQDIIIRNTLLWTLAVSSIIILLLISAYVYFIRTVLRQKRLSAMKTDFINNMTHEFMTPVTNIGLALETLEQKTAYKEEDRRRIMELIAAENAHLKENIDKVLQVAVLEKGSFLLDPAPVNIHEVLQRVVRSFGIQIQAKEGTVLFELQAGDPVVIADETHIINLFYNIIDNAVKYSAERPLEIIIRSGRDNKRLWVSIEDNGKGMSAQETRNIFDKFYRGATGDVHDVKGFGLGLTYVKSIADAHNITIDVKSTAGSGTMFTLWFNQQ